MSEQIEVTVHGRMGSGPVDVRTLDAFCRMITCVHQMIEDGAFSEGVGMATRIISGHEWRQRAEAAEAKVDRLEALLDRAYPWLHNPYHGTSDFANAAEGDAVIEAVQTAIQHVPDDQESLIGSVLYGPCDGFFGQAHYGAWVVEAEGKDYVIARALDKQEAAGPRVAVFHPTHNRRALIEKWSSEESRRLWMDED